MNRRFFYSLTLTTALTGGLFAQAPPPPQNLKAKVIQMDMVSVVLHWDAGDPGRDATFSLYRAVDGAASFDMLASSLHFTEFRDVDVMPGHSYAYTVTAIRGDQESTPSDTADVAIPVRLLGSISGTVTDDSSGAPLRGVRIKFFPVNDVSVFHWFDRAVYTDSLGHYEATLDTGTYLVKAEALCFDFLRFPSYQTEWYDNSPTADGATPVIVSDGSSFTADFGLSHPVPPTFITVTGTVTDTLGHPLPRASVALMRTLQQMSALAVINGMSPGRGDEEMDIDGLGHTRGVMWKGFTDSLGMYHARVIAGKDYVALAAKRGYLPEYFDQKSDPTEADILHLSADTSGIDFSLAVNPDLQNSVSGHVVDSTGTGVPSRIVLFPVTREGRRWGARFAHTDSLGAYTLEHVRTGNYFVLAIPFSDYAPAFYKAGAFGVRHWKNADTVGVSGAVSGIDIGVVPVTSDGFAHISGRIHSADGTPVDGVSVFALESDNSVGGYTFTDASGSYALDGISSGTIEIIAARDGYNESRQSIEVSPGVVSLPGVNLTLAPSQLAGAGGGPPLPARFELRQNYPNPFNPTTSISFDVPVESHVTLTVYNLLGQQVSTLFSADVPAGTRNVVWHGDDENGAKVSSGLYFYKIKAESLDGTATFNQVRKMILLK